MQNITLGDVTMASTTNTHSPPDQCIPCVLFAPPFMTKRDLRRSLGMFSLTDGMKNAASKYGAFLKSRIGIFKVFQVEMAKGTFLVYLPIYYLEHKYINKMGISLFVIRGSIKKSKE